MTNKGEKTRQRLLLAMVDKLQTHGYTGTGLNDIVAAAEAPRGSLYFHFPNGKEQLAAAAVDLAAAVIRDQLDASCRGATSPGEVVEFAARAFGDVLQGSDFQKGCPVTAVAATIGEKTPDLQRACAQAFDSWTVTLASHLMRTRVPEARARALAQTGLAGVEGALIMARAQRSLAPFHAAVALQAALAEDALREADDA
ncbi:putative HTH-type transcriptional regulator YxaF [Brevundimonas sp. SH203]|uniref:TetR/AcrR family transcriptional regulator n=1 Tax=Brevundimonas sp. SH203 TaxID=345167 RepID=UPI0009C6D30A|nr:TetR/AcrR family transcriptional regulator [Brevundimonas sp. SH203]GAW42275.1 putative HTH-type transcriptional regulator YxaF [Brevundimonas sp. SH203]